MRHCICVHSSAVELMGSSKKGLHISTAFGGPCFFQTCCTLGQSAVALQPRLRKNKLGLCRRAVRCGSTVWAKGARGYGGGS